MSMIGTGVALGNMCMEMTQPDPDNEGKTRKTLIPDPYADPYAVSVLSIGLAMLIADESSSNAVPAVNPTRLP